MKKVNLKLFLFLLSASFSFHLFAQQTTVDIRIEYGYLFGDQTGLLLNDGLKTGADTIKEQKIKSVRKQSNYYSEKSTEINYYNSKGQLAKHTLTDPRFKIIDLYTYTANGDLATFTQYTNKKIVSIDSFFYNDKVKCEHIHHSDFKDHSDYVFDFKYDNQNRIKTMSGKFTTGELEYYTYEYDNSGNNNFILEVSCDSSGCDTLLRIVIKRDPFNRITAIDEWNKHIWSLPAEGDTITKPQFAQIHCSFTYDTNGLIIHKTESFIYNRKTEKLFSYDAQHRLQTEKIIRDEKDTTRNIHYYFPQMDSIVTPRPDYSDPRLSMINLEIITFNAQGQKIKCFKSTGQVGYLTFFTDEKQFWKYDAQGRLLEINKMVPDEKVYNAYISADLTAYSYDKNGLIKQSYYISGGKKKWTDCYTYTFYK
jgi:hypothetical protein